jgi:hypothetical protein
MMQHDPGSVEPSTIDLDNRLKTLKDGPFFDRKKAADDLARLPQSSEQVIAALMEAAQTDSDPGVRSAAIRALEMPVHFQYLQSYARLADSLADIKRHNDTLEAAANEGDDDSGWGIVFRLLKDMWQLIVGVIILFVLPPDLPEIYRWAGIVVVSVFGIVFMVKKYSKR